MNAGALKIGLFFTAKPIHLRQASFIWEILFIEAFPSKQHKFGRNFIIHICG